MKTATWRSGSSRASASSPSLATSTAMPRWRSIVSITIWLTGLSSATRTTPARPDLRRRGGRGRLGGRASPEHLRERLEQRGAPDRLGQRARHVGTPPSCRPRSASPAGVACSSGVGAHRAAPPRRRPSRASRSPAGRGRTARPRAPPRPASRQRRRAVLGVVADARRGRAGRRCTISRFVALSSTTSTRVCSGSASRVRAARALGVDHLERDLEAERAAAAGLGLGGQLAAHDRDQPARDREPQPGAAEAARRRRVGLREGLEQLRELLARRCRSRCRRPDAQQRVAVAGSVGLDAHRRPRPRR